MTSNSRGRQITIFFLATVLFCAARVNEVQAGQKVLEVRIYASVIAGSRESRAVASTRPLAKLLARKTGIPIHLAAEPGSTSEDLKNFGDRLNSGQFHYGVVHGIEYGWLKEFYPELKPMILASQGSDAGAIAPKWPVQILVGPDSNINGVADLGGKRIAIYKGQPLQSQLFLAKVLQDNRLKCEFTDALPSVKDAIEAVFSNDADAIAIDQVAYTQHLANQPKRKLKLVAASQHFPGIVIIGRQDRVDAIREGLWAQFKNEYLNLHKDREAQRPLNFWRVKRFVEPTKENFFNYVQARVKEYPLRNLDKVIGQ